MQVLLRQARVYDPASDFHNQVVDIFIEHGVIREIGTALDMSADQEITGADLEVSPGWVDVFADYREPGFEHKETISSGLRAAAAGGFTRVLIVPNTQPVLDNKSSMQYVLRQAAGHVTSLHPLGAVTQRTEGKHLAEMLDMHRYGALAFSDGWKPVQQAHMLLKALEYVKAFDGIVIQVPVDEALSAGGLMHEGPVSTRLGMAGVPALAETLMVHRDIELLRYTGSRLHLTGISAAGSVALIRRAKAEGLPVTCSVTPYHLALTDEALTGYSSLYKVTPPLRAEEDRRALIAGFEDGTIDCLASHHRPQEWDAKAKEFEYASDGMNVQQFSAGIAWQAVRGTVSRERLLDAICFRPRQIFGLPAPVLEKGAHAELTIFNTFETHKITGGHSLSDNNPLKGTDTGIRISAVVGNGQVFIQ